MGFSDRFKKIKDTAKGALSALKELNTPSDAQTLSSEKTELVTELVNEIRWENGYKTDSTRPAPRVMVIDTPKITQRLQGLMPESWLRLLGQSADALMHDAQTGGGQPLLVVFSPMLDLLNRRELKAILGHELSHIPQFEKGKKLQQDMIREAINANKEAANQSVLGLLKLIVKTMQAKSEFANIWQEQSKAREFEADAGAGTLTGDRQALISALEKMQANNEELLKASGFKSLNNFIEKFVKMLGGEIVDNHPSLFERTTALKNNICKMGEGYQKLLGDGKDDNSKELKR